MAFASILRDTPLIAVSEQFRRVLTLALRLAATDRPILIEGESGTGKERLARFIHESSSRSQGPFKIWHAGEANANLAAGELFGVCKGAFTGADRVSEGMIESAGGGTFVVDDVDKLPDLVQALLLRFLDQGTAHRLGSTEYRPLKARPLFTTNRSLRWLAERGQFLPDLAFRIQGLRIEIPPLRERKEDIRPIAEQIVLKLASESRDGRNLRFDQEAMALLESDPWPGNVREVEEVVQNIYFREVNGGAIGPSEVKQALLSRYCHHPGVDIELQYLKGLPEKERRSREIVTRAFRLLEGNGRRTARFLCIPERTLRLYLHRYGLLRTGSPAGAKIAGLRGP